MTISKKNVLASLVGVVLVVSISAFGYYRNHSNPERHAAYIVEEVSEELELNETQLANLNTLKDEILASHKQIHQNKQDKVQVVLELVEGPTFNRDQALAHISETMQTMDELAPTVIAALGDFYDSLTPDQQHKLREKIEDRAEHHSHHGHSGQHEGHG